MFLSKKIFFIFILVGNIIFAQNSFSNFSITRITPDNGLSQGSNYFRYEDHLGFVWITGNDAINRYDGNYIKVYKKDFYFEKCKNLQQGYGFAEDDGHNIYIGSTNGLYIYKRKKDKFNVKFLVPKGKDQTVLSIGYADGKIWCHNKNFDIISYDIKNNSSRIFSISSTYKVNSFHIYDNRESPIFCRVPFLDVQKNIWIINPNGVLFFNTKTNKTKYYLEKYLSDNKLKIYSSCFDKFNNTLLIGTNNCLLVFNCKKGTIEIKKKIIKTKSIAVNKDIITLRNDKNFEVYNKEFKSLYTQKFDENFATSYTYSFDKINRLWMCQDGFGQLILDFKPPFLNKVSSTVGFLKTGVGLFSEFSDGNCLIQNNLIFKKQKKKFEKINIKEDNSIVYISNVSDIRNNKIWQVVQNKDEAVSLYFIDKNKKQQLYCDFSVIPKTGLLQDAVLVRNNLLCSFQSGLYLLDLKKKSIKKLSHQTKENSFKINPISKNRIIVSYLNQEATLYQLNNDNDITSSKNILHGYQAFYFQEDTIKNRIWSGTNNGILVLDHNFKIIKKIDSNNNLAGTYIYGILLDDAGNCWASHQRGLSFINTDNYNIINFTKEDGIQDWDFNNRAYYKSTDGTLFFGGMKGFNYFKPPLKYDNKIYQSRVYIDEILINQKLIKSNINSDYIKRITLDPDENNISIHAIVRNISRGKQSPIIYRINNSEWIYKTSDCIIDLANLAPDDYKLDLGVYEKFENKTFVQKTLLITISAPFYYKIWFWVLFTFILVSLVFWFLNNQKLAKQKRKFEQQLALEQQRTKITADLHDDIGSTLSSLQINSAVANKLMDKDIISARKTLVKIEEQSKNLADKIGDIIWSMKPGKDEFMTLSTRIKNFTSDILEHTEIDYKIDIDTIIDAKITDINARKNIVFFIKEAVNNAVKYSKATHLTISIREKNNAILIGIMDDGIGFDPSEIKGNGIRNMKKRIEELKGEFSIKSDSNTGTTIRANIFSIT